MKSLKKTLLTDIAAMSFIMMTAVACNQAPEDTKEVAEDHNEAKFDDNNRAENDAQFLVDAAAINLHEIQLGQLAAAQATSQEVKELGMMVEKDHSKTLNELKDLAARKTITIPVAASEDDTDKYNNLSKKTGRDFDKDICDRLVEEHKDAISKFEKASTESNDAEIKQWAANTLPTLRSHLDMALSCQEKVK